MSDDEIVIAMNRDDYIANKKVARDVLNDILKETIDIVNCMENFQHLKLSNKSIRELTLNIYFIESLPCKILEESKWLQEYKLYGDVNILEFKETMTMANAFVNDLLKDSLKMTAYIETWENKALQEKLENVQDVIKLSDIELTEKLKYNFAFQTFPTVDINILSGCEAFAKLFVDSIITDAADIVLFKVSPEIFKDVVESEISQSIAAESLKLQDDIGEMEIKSATAESLQDDIGEVEIQSATENVREVLDANSIMNFPLIRDFTLQVGQTLVDQIVSKWCFDKEWMYFIQYSDYSHDTCYEFHKYEVIFSIPTPSYPIPQATASVFFTITINKLQHENYPIEVSYNMEGSSYIHPPDITSFNQDWLYAILCNKIKFLKRICSMDTI